MLWLKSCPHCKGGLYQDRDLYGRYLACFQCGHYLSKTEEAALRYSSPQWLLRYSVETTNQHSKKPEARQPRGASLLG
jgi:DNA-directed RNA polymerase subunit M/transcription elongation factor TFIIS